MPSTDPRIDAYIEKSKDFAKPVLQHIRQLVHKAVPGIEETWKWSFPHFVYKGSTLCSMAAFKEHCAFGFWKAAIMKDPENLFNKDGKNAMGQFDRITSLKDLPKDKVLIAYMKEPAALNEADIKVPKVKKARVVMETPAALTAALNNNKKAKATFESFSPSHRNEYIEWITEAKTEATKDRRIATTIEWLQEGKSRNWKYER